jgi:hypothetical protein
MKSPVAGRRKKEEADALDAGASAFGYSQAGATDNLELLSYVSI